MRHLGKKNGPRPEERGIAGRKKPIRLFSSARLEEVGFRAAR
jgi:hypothetical protein